ncbi:PCI domain-containing protein, partial [Haematococcus lacustris]
LHQAEALITSIEARVAYANQASETADKKRAEAQAKAEEMKKNVKAELELRSADMMLDDPTAGLAELMEEDRFDGQLGAGALTGLAGERERQDRAAPRQGGRRWEGRPAMPKPG